jgi:hypothetical protein
MVALWLIEGIRAGGKFPSLNALCFHVGENSTDWTKASEMTRRRLIVIYRIWWEKAKVDPKSAAKVNPLAGTKLHWY